MSEYLEFYLKVGERFAPLYTCCRGGAVYEAFEPYAPAYAAMRPLTTKVLKWAREEIGSSRKSLEAMRVRETQTIDFLKESNLGIEERLEALNDCQRLLEYAADELKNLGFAENFVAVLEEMLDAADLSLRYSTNETSKFDPADYIYFGIECEFPKFGESENLKNSEN